MSDALTDDQRCVLLSLDGRGDAWQRPMDVGGSDGSHHSRTLAKLAAMGLAERRDRGSITGRRAVWLYRITSAGTTAITKDPTP
jgi:hypothetical protein